MAVQQATTDLWPSDFGGVGETSPLVILRQQATLLSQKTKNVVQGEIRTEPVQKFLSRSEKEVGDNKPAHGWYNPAVAGVSQGSFVQTGELRHTFYLKVPALENYRYQLLTVTSNPLEYPVRVEAKDVDEVCESESAYIDVLRQILSSEHTVRIVRNLMEQVKG